MPQLLSRNVALLSLLTAMTSTGAMASSALNLNFDSVSCALPSNGMPLPCLNGFPISQGHGDNSWVDVSYSSDVASAAPNSLFFWGIGYDGVSNVVWGNAGQVSRLTLQLRDPGQRIALDGLVLGSLFGLQYDTRVQVFDLGTGASLFDSGSLRTAGATANTLSFTSGVSSTTGLRLDFGPDFYNVALDSLNYSVSAVPEPTSLALMALGLAGLVGVQRQRRKQA